MEKIAKELIAVARDLIANEELIENFVDDTQDNILEAADALKEQTRKLKRAYDEAMRKDYEDDEDQSEIGVLENLIEINENDEQELREMVRNRMRRLNWNLARR